jgi:predicted 2-oxoglutarate/Fe(II)-dependent dioxygenase YbiX
MPRFAPRSAGGVRRGDRPRGTRPAMIFWTQSMVRDALYAMFQTLENLEKPLAATPELTQLYAYYYNLIRMWATP